MDGLSKRPTFSASLSPAADDPDTILQPLSLSETFRTPLSDF